MPPTPINSPGEIIADALRVADDYAGHPLVWPLLSFWRWVQQGRCLIEDRDTSRIVPLVPNYIQRDIFSAMLRQAVAGIPVDLIILKSRRMGSSTIVQAPIRYICSRFTGRRAITYAHTEDDTARIFELPQRMQRGDADDHDGRCLATSIHWDALDSDYECRTAGGKGVSHGSGNHFAHISELAWMEKKSGLDADALGGILHAVSTGPHTMRIIESTGNGNSGEFFTRCDRARRGIGDSVLLFYPWHRDARYVAPVHPGLRLTDYEQTIHDAYNLSMEQMAWYHRKFANECGDGKDLGAVARFQREFPTTYEEAFAVPKGRVYPAFSTLVHVPAESRAADLRAVIAAEHAKARELARVRAAPVWVSGEPDAPQWEFYRAIDWGASYEHPFACTWIGHDPKAAPGFLILPECQDGVREFLDYSRNAKTGAPNKADDHVPDAARICVATCNLSGLVVMYRLLYDRNPPPLPILARQIHEMSGWIMPETANDLDLAKHVVGPDGEIYRLGVADRSRPDSITLFGTWGIPLIGHRAPEQSPTKQGEVEDGIALLASLMSGRAYMIPVYEDAKRKLIESAESKERGAYGRPRGLTVEEQDAVDSARTPGRRGTLAASMM